MGNFGFQELLLLFIILGIGIIPIIFFLITLQNTLKVVEPQNRKMQPGNVWLLLIPLFGFVWSFVLVSAIADSCKAQLEQYDVYYEQRPTYSIGMGWAVCLVLSMIVKLFSIVSIAMFITYWVKVNDVRKELITLKEVHERRDDGSIL